MSAPEAEVEALRAELAAARAENARLVERYDLFQKATSDAFWDWDLATDRVDWNPGVYMNFGYKVGEVEPTAAWWADHVHPDDRARVVEAIHEAQAAGRAAWEGDYRFRKGDGGYAWVLDRGYCLFDARGRAVRMVGAMQDMTRQREAELRFRQLADTMPILVWSTRPDGYHDYYNRRWYEYTNTTPGDTDDWGWHRLLHPDDRARTADAWRHSLETGEPYDIVYRFRNGATGEYRWFSGQAAPAFDAEGNITRWYGTCTDVQGQVEQAEALRRANETLAMQAEELEAANEELAAQQQQIVEQSQWEVSRSRHFAEVLLAQLPAGVSFVDTDLVIQVANEAYGRFSGVPVGSLLGRPFFEVFPEAREAVAPLFDRVRETRVPFSAQAFPVTIAGRQTYWDFTMAPMTEVDGSFAGYLTLALEVSARVELERKLAEQGELTRQVLAHTPAGISYVDKDLVYRSSNPFQLKFMGRTAEQVVDKTLTEVWGPEADAQVGDLLREVLRTGVPYSATGLAFDQVFDGVPSKSYWDFTYAPVFGPDGKPQGVLVLTQEVTDRIKREQLAEERLKALQEADRTKDEFLSVISHELRTPLNFITGFASTLEDEVQGPLNAGQKQAVGRILAGADRMLGIVDDLLDFARMQAGRLHLNRKPADFAAVVAEVAAGARPAADAREVAIAAEVAALPPVPLDAARMVQVLNNLVSNAIKFTPKGGRITVSAREDAGALLCEVTDTGIGIAPGDQAKLFQRFHQLDMGATREAGGTGLGLAISKAIVESHGGTIGVRSEGAGRGSTFWFRVPLG